jgi:hypothetical protein
MNRHFLAISAIALGLSTLAGTAAAEGPVENHPAVAAVTKDRATVKAELIAANRAGALSHNEASLNSWPEALQGNTRLASKADGAKPVVRR